jgi:hypothetical protein
MAASCKEEEELQSIDLVMQGIEHWVPFEGNLDLRGKKILLETLEEALMLRLESLELEEWTSREDDEVQDDDDSRDA